MGSLFEWITDWIKEGLIDAITGQYTSIFNSVNNQVADVANQVGQTPQARIRYIQHLQVDFQDFCCHLPAHQLFYDCDGGL